MRKNFRFYAKIAIFGVPHFFETKLAVQIGGCQIKKFSYFFNVNFVEQKNFRKRSFFDRRFLAKTARKRPFRVHLRSAIFLRNFRSSHSAKNSDLSVECEWDVALKKSASVVCTEIWRIVENVRNPNGHFWLFFGLTGKL